LSSLAWLLIFLKSVQGPPPKKDACEGVDRTRNGLGRGGCGSVSGRIVAAEGIVARAWVDRHLTSDGQSSLSAQEEDIAVS
jgi:hypothetical protein